jgi:hypothetical protein
VSNAGGIIYLLTGGEITEDTTLLLRLLVWVSIAGVIIYLLPLGSGISEDDS